MLVKKKLPVFIALLVAIPLIVTSIISYIYTSNVFMSESTGKITLLSDLSSTGISSLINGEKKEAELFSKRKDIIDIAKLRLSNNNEEFYLLPQINSTNEVLKERFDKFNYHEHLFVVDKDGTIIADSNPGSLKVNIKDRNYFKEAIQGKISISNTVISKVNGKPVIVFAAPIVDETGNIIGVMANSVFAEYFVKNLENIKLGSTGYAYIVDSEGIMLSHPTKDKIGKPVENDKMKGIVERLKKGETIKNTVEDYIYNGTKKKMGCYIVPEVNWVFALTQDLSDINSASKTLMLVMGITAAISLLLAIIFGIIFSRGITNPINKLMVIMDRASKGDIAVKSEIKSKDELESLSDSFNIMIENIASVIKLVKLQSEKIDNHSQNLSAVSEEMSASSDEVSKAIQEVAASSGNQAVNLSGVTEIVNEFGSEIGNIVVAINEIDQNAKEVSKLARTSNNNMGPLVDSVDKINVSFTEFAKKILELGKDINRINEITAVLNNIADQTNLLALNASIEAARAGEAGRGFSVVAEEIRKLAEQSKKSSENINKLIGGISKHANEMVESTEVMNGEFNSQVNIINVAVDSFKEIIRSIDMVVPMIGKVGKSAGNIDNEKETILKRVEGVAAFAEEVSASSEEIAASSEEMSASSSEVASSAQELSLMTKDMIEEVNKFKI